MYNKVILAGNLARPIEIRYTQGGSAIAKTAIATNRKFKSQTGEQKEEVMFIDITFFGRTAEIANQYLRKGSKILIDGRLTLDQWTGQDGSKNSKHSITVENLQMLDGRDAGTNGAAGHMGQPQAALREQQKSAPDQQNHQRPAPQQQADQSIPEIDISEDEIPF